MKTFVYTLLLALVLGLWTVNVQAAIGTTTNNVRHLLQEGEEEQPPATSAPEAEEDRVIAPGTATPEELSAALGERAQLFPGLDQQEGGGRRLQQQGDDDDGGFLIIQPVGIIGLPPIIVVPLEALAPAPETETETGGGGRRLSQLTGGDEDGVTLEERLEALQEVLGEILVAPEAEELLQVVVAPETESK